METSDQAIKKVLDNLAGDQKAGVQEALEKLSKDLFRKGAAPMEAMGIGKDMVEAIYSFAYQLYTTGKYDQALNLFRVLVMLNPAEEKFLFGIAACFHMKKEYQNAAMSYTLCSVLSPEEPSAYFHASDCYMELEKPDLAKRALKLCIEHCGSDPAHQAMKSRAEVSLDGLKERASQAKGA